MKKKSTFWNFKNNFQIKSNVKNARIKMFDSSLININMLTIEHFLFEDKDFMINTRLMMGFKNNL
jgi:hypothetical protein